MSTLRHAPCRFHLVLHACRWLFFKWSELWTRFFFLTCNCGGHTPSIAFRHLPPNSARFSYATEGALFVSAQLSSDAVSGLRKVRVLIWLQNQPSTKARTQTWDASTPGKKEKKKEFRFDSNDCGFICAALLAAINDTPCFIWVVCNKLTTVWAPTKNCSLADSFLDPMA